MWPRAGAGVLLSSLPTVQQRCVRHNARCAASPSRTRCTCSCEQPALCVRGRYARRVLHRAPAGSPAIRRRQLRSSGHTRSLPAACGARRRTVHAPGTRAVVAGAQQRRHSALLCSTTFGLSRLPAHSPEARGARGCTPPRARHRPCGTSRACLLPRRRGVITRVRLRLLANPTAAPRLRQHAGRR